MNITGVRTCSAGAAINRLATGLRRLSGVMLIMGLLLALCPARAQEPDEQYLRVYNMIQQADALNTSGSNAQALVKYQNAQTALQRLKRASPNWNPQVVTFRLNYLADRIASLSKEAPASGDANSGTREGGAGTRAAAGSSSTVQVKLVEAGAEPRTVLRLHPKAGDKQSVLLTIKLAMDMAAGQMPGTTMKMPAMKMPMDLTIKDVSSEGDINFEVVVGETSIADDPDAMPQFAEAMKAALSGLKGMSGTGTMSNRGISKGTTFKAPPAADAQAQQTIEQMKDSFNHLSIPLPEEAVGTGAKWEARMLVKSQGMSIDQTSSFQVITIEGEHITTKTTLTQAAANQKVQSPAMPGLKMDLNKMSGTGSGETAFDLAQLLPSSVKMDSHTETDMSLNMAGQKQAMNMKMDMSITIAPK